MGLFFYICLAQKTNTSDSQKTNTSDSQKTNMCDSQKTNTCKIRTLAFPGREEGRLWIKNEALRGKNSELWGKNAFFLTKVLHN